MTNKEFAADLAVTFVANFAAELIWNKMIDYKSARRDRKAAKNLQPA